MPTAGLRVALATLFLWPIMLHQGQVVLDVSGDERARMDVPDLLAMFERTRGEKVSDDALLLG